MEYLMEFQEKIYIGFSILLFFGFLPIGLGSGSGGHGGGGFFELIFLVFCFFMVMMGLTLVYQARKKGDIFWVLLVATLMACSYIAIMFTR